MQIHTIPDVIKLTASERIYVPNEMSMSVANASIVFVRRTETMRQKATKRYGFIKSNIRFILMNLFLQSYNKNSIETKKE